MYVLTTLLQHLRAGEAAVNAYFFASKDHLTVQEVLR
jgi:hypothetical protein